MDLVVLQKIESSILNGLGYIGRLEKKNGNKKICGIRLYSSSNPSIYFRKLDSTAWIDKYVAVIKPLKTQGFSDFDIANFSK